MSIEDNIWIGLAHVKSRSNNGVLGIAKGAFVNVIAYASNVDDYIDKVAVAVNDLELDFIEIEDLELLSERKTKSGLNQGLSQKAIEVSETKGLRFGNFHTFDDA